MPRANNYLFFYYRKKVSLNDKEDKETEEYLIDLNVTQATIRAG